MSRYFRCAVLFGATMFAASSANAAVAISSKPTQNMSCTGGICTPTAKKAVLNVSDLTAMLASGDTTIKSTNANPDIEIDAALSWTSTSRLTLDAYRSITFNKPIVVAGTGALTITTNDGGSGGDYSFSGKGHIEFWDMTSNLNINGNDYVLAKSIKQLKTAANRGAGYLALVESLNLSKHHYHQAPIPNYDGTFEGLGNVISNLTINDPTANDQVALFGSLSGSSGHDEIRDIGLKAVNISGNGGCVATLVAVSGFGRVTNSYATGQVSVASDGQFGAGGLICGGGGNVTRSHASVAISVTGVLSGGSIGGLIGSNVGACVGGPCIGVVSESYATGAVAGIDGTIIGGLVGRNSGGILQNSYSVGAVSGGQDSVVGGLIGSNENEPSENAFPLVTDAYSTSAVSGGSGATLGGLIGQDIANPGIADSYWDLDTSGITDPSHGAGNIADDPGITGLSDAQLQSALPAGFDKKVWKQKGSVNNGYPYLANNPPPE